MKVEWNRAQLCFERYNSLNGIRAYAAIAILLMHIYANSSYSIDVLQYSPLLSIFNNLTFLFMMVSAFSMCCGYYERFTSGTISLIDFYKRRYAKIWPYFALLVLLDFVLFPSVSSLYEAFADLTLVFGLLPNASITVIGVGWFLGVVFIFYMFFPFFCFLISDKRRAWLATAITVIYNILCNEYFLNTDHVVETYYYRHSFIFCSMFFMVGGLIYLYRKELIEIVKKTRSILLIVCIGSFLLYFFFDCLRTSVMVNLSMLVIFALWTIYAISTNGKIMNNKVTTFIAGISMEIYLCHMMVFRVLEKMGLIYMFGYGWMSYVVTAVAVIVGAILFSLCAKLFLKKVRYVVGKLIT